MAKVRTRLAAAEADVDADHRGSSTALPHAVSTELTAVAPDAGTTSARVEAELRATRVAGVPAGTRPATGSGRWSTLLGDPQRGYPVDPRHRHQRQDHHGPDDRRAAARVRAAGRPVHQPAPGLA